MEEHPADLQIKGNVATSGTLKWFFSLASRAHQIIWRCLQHVASLFLLYSVPPPRKVLVDYKGNTEILTGYRIFFNSIVLAVFE